MARRAKERKRDGEVGLLPNPTPVPPAEPDGIGVPGEGVLGGSGWDFLQNPRGMAKMGSGMGQSAVIGQN